MNGTHLVDTLKEIGYPGVAQLDGPCLDWMFESKAIQPFLEWFCTEVHGSNVLTTKEIQEYKQLRDSKEVLLEGNQLEEALANLSSLDGEYMSEEKLRQEIEYLEEELQLAEERKDVLIQQRNKLSIHHTSVTDRVDKLGNVENGVKADYKMCLEQCQADNIMMNQSLDSLVNSVSNLTQLYQKSASGTVNNRGTSSTVFMSQLELDQYHKTEEKFTQELTAFTKKQFFEGIAEMAGQKDGSRYDFLEISTPESLFVKGEDEHTVLDNCKELAILQSCYPMTEIGRINALIDEKSTEAACNFAEGKLDSFRHRPYPQNITDLSEKLSETETVLSVVRKDAVKLSQGTLPSLVKESAASQVTKVLQGDYQLKIARQDYFISKQDQVVDHLVTQRARNEFLTLAYEIEEYDHRDTHHLLSTITMKLQKNFKSLQARLNMMKDPSLSNTRHTRSTIDSRDKGLTRLHEMLDKSGQGGKKELFVTYSKLEEEAEGLHQRLSSSKTSLSSTNSHQDSRMLLLENNLKACESMVYSGSSTTGGQPVLSPQPIVDALTQLDSMFKKLEQAVIDIVKEIEVKKRTLRNDALQTTERDLFVYFFTDPGKLRRSIEEVNSRLEAQKAK